MKTFYSLLLFSIILIESITLKAQVGTFSKVYTGQSYEEGIKAFRLPDFTYRIIGNTGTYGWGGTNIWLIALDSSANFMWHKTYGAGGVDKAEDAVMDSQGNIIIVGSSTSEANNSYQIIYINIDKNGAINSQQYLGGADWEFGHGIERISDSLYMIVGETYSYGNGQSDAWILQVNELGTILWDKTLGGIKKEAFFDIKINHDGGYICAGQSQSYGNGSFDPILYRTNQFGDSIALSHFADTTDGGFYSLTIASDSGIIGVGYQRDTTNTYEDFTIIKMDKLGQLMWNRFQLRHQQDANYRAVLMQNEKIIVAGMSTRFGKGGQGVYGSMLAQDGWWMKSFIMGRENDEYTHSMTIDTTESLHYLLVGTTRSYGISHSGILFVRMDSTLKWDTVVELMVPSGINQSYSNLTEVSIYPNPFSDVITFDKKNNAQNQNLELYVYDMIGHLILSKTWPKNNETISINTSNWSPSSYVFVLKNDKYIQRQLIILTR